MRRPIETRIDPVNLVPGPHRRHHILGCALRVPIHCQQENHGHSFDELQALQTSCTRAAVHAEHRHSMCPE